MNANSDALPLFARAIVYVGDQKILSLAKRREGDLYRKTGGMIVSISCKKLKQLFPEYTVIESNPDSPMFGGLHPTNGNTSWYRGFALWDTMGRNTIFILRAWLQVAKGKLLLPTDRISFHGDYNRETLSHITREYARHIMQMCEQSSQEAKQQ